MIYQQIKILPLQESVEALLSTQPRLTVVTLEMEHPSLMNPLKIIMMVSFLMVSFLIDLELFELYEVMYLLLFFQMFDSCWVKPESSLRSI